MGFLAEISYLYSKYIENKWKYLFPNENLYFIYEYWV